MSNIVRSAGAPFDQPSPPPCHLGQSCMLQILKKKCFFFFSKVAVSIYFFEFEF